MYAPVHKETFYESSPRNYGYGYDGGSGMGVGGWVGGGVAFLFLVFLILGFAIFHRGDQDKVHGMICENNSANHADQQAAAYYRGKTEARQEDMYQEVKAIAAKQEKLAHEVTRGFDYAIAATKDGVKDLELFGQNFGYRTYDKVYHDPCGARDRPHHDVIRTTKRPYTPPESVYTTENVCA